MSMALYSPEDVYILLGGIYQVEGLMDGSFVSIAKDAPRYETAVTADGRVTRTHKNVPTHTLTLTTTSVADVNNLLSAWVAADGYLHGAILPIFIKDGNGTSTFYAPECWIEEEPEIVYSTEIEGRQWKLKCVNGSSTIGGNGMGGVIDGNLAALGFLAADFGGMF